MNLETAPIEIAYDHYKDTFSYVKEFEKDRNQLFFRILFLSLFIFLFLYYPLIIENVILSLFESKYGELLDFDFIIVRLSLTLFIFYNLLRYLQITIQISHYYKYLHRLEEGIGKLLPTIKFSREGKHYKDEFTFFKKMVRYIYTVLFPILLILILILNSIINIDGNLMLTIINTLISIFSILIILVHMVSGLVKTIKKMRSKQKSTTYQIIIECVKNKEVE